MKGICIKTFLNNYLLLNHEFPKPSSDILLQYEKKPNKPQNKTHVKKVLFTNQRGVYNLLFSKNFQGDIFEKKFGPVGIVIPLSRGGIPVAWYRLYCQRYLS